jgi:integrase
MKTHNAENERIKRRYLAFQKEAKRHSEASIDGIAKALARFETYTKYKDFKAFHFQQAVSFKNSLAEQKAERSGERLSKATMHSTLANLKRFFQWLADQPGFRSRLKYTDADYFNLSEKDVRVATAKRDQRAPTMEQVKYVLGLMPAATDIQRRNRALVALTLLTGARDSALASFKLKHIDLIAGCVHQDAREVKTKFSKTFSTYFFPVGDEVLVIISDWVRYLQEELKWGNDDPLFPATQMALDENGQFKANGLKRQCWSNATPIRTIFKQAFEHAGLAYFNPHSFRHLLVRHGEVICSSPEEFKAWSQNLGHEQVLTTFTSYGNVDLRRQGDIIKNLSKPKLQHSPDLTELVRETLRQVNQQARV